MMGFEMHVPALGKAIIALAIPVMGYSCDLATQNATRVSPSRYRR